MNLFKLSWRNVWRNKRRTLITVASVLFAVLFAIVMRAFQEGTYSRAIENMVQMMSGHLQIQAQGYWDDQIIDNVFVADADLVASLDAMPEVKYAFPRLQFFAFASTGQVTRESIIMGINPELEEPIAKLADKLIYGTISTSESTGIVLTEGLARNLGIIRYEDSLVTSLQDGVAHIDTIRNLRMEMDTLIVIGQGYRGSSASGKYCIEGIVKLPIPELNKRVVYMPLPLAQYLFDAEGMLTSLNILLHNPSDQVQVQNELQSKVNPSEYAVLSWQEMQKELLQQIESDKGSGKITVWLLYIIIGFGILGTIIMMTTERKREFGIMVSIGMQKTLLSKQVAMELFFMGLLGVSSGALLSLPILLYYHFNPIRFTGDLALAYESYGWEAIMPVSIDPFIFWEQAITVFILFGLSSIYAIVQIFKLDVKTAIHK